MRNLPRLCVFLQLFLVAICGRAAADAPTVKAHRLSPGTEFETPWYDINTGVAGPVVMIIGGVHGNEPAGRYAAEQIRHWPLKKGRLIVVPAVNRLGLVANMRWLPAFRNDDKLRDPNRNFPKTGDTDETLTPPCQALWQLAKDIKPEWVIDLHEGFDFHIANDKSVGSSVIFPKTDPTAAFAHQMLDAVNATITDPQRKFVALDRGPVDGSFARAAIERLGCNGFIAETTFKDQPISLRVRQHRLMTSICLKRLGMIDEDCINQVAAKRTAGVLQVGIYDAAGAGGDGPAALTKILEADPRYVVRHLGPAELQAISLEPFTLIIFPGGSGSKQANAIGPEAREKVREFVKSGGGYLGICAGAYLCASNYDWSLKLVDLKALTGTVKVDGDTKQLWYRGPSELVKLELTAEGREILGDHPGMLQVRYHNGPIVSPAGNPDLPTYLPLAYFRSEVAALEKQKGTMIDTPAIVASHFGKGRVLAISPHPESTEGLTSLVSHAVAWVCQEEPAAAVAKPAEVAEPAEVK